MRRTFQKEIIEIMTVSETKYRSPDYKYIPGNGGRHNYGITDITMNDFAFA
jgi:hypothetical protein